MWSRSSVTRTRMQCIAFSLRAEGSDELKTCDELLYQADRVQQQTRAAPVDADLRFDRKYKLECVLICSSWQAPLDMTWHGTGIIYVHYMSIVCPLHPIICLLGLLLLPTTTANSFSLSKSSLLLYGRAFSWWWG